MTALMWAARDGKLDCLELLIAKGAKLDATTNVSAAPPAAPPSPLRPSPSAFRHHLPARRRRSPACVRPPPRLGSAR